LVLAIQIDKVDRKFHPESVYGFTGENPEALFW
jgi:hypothetical protein